MAKPPRIDADSLEKAALRYLDRFDSTAANLKKILEARVKKATLLSSGLDEKVVQKARQCIDALIVRYQESGLIDDKRYCEAHIHSFRRRGLSSRAIRYKLRLKGVADELIDEVLADEAELEGGDQDRVELESAKALMKRRRLGIYRVKGDREEYREKDLAALSRAGFSYDIARKALDGEGDEF